MTIHLDQHYIRAQDAVLDSLLCQEIVALFELDSERHFFDGDRYIELDVFGNPCQGQYRDRWLVLADAVVQALMPVVNDYRLQWDPRGMLPDQFALEGLRVKAYRPGEHQFRLHVDQDNRDSATRFIAVLFYLNDNSAGTEFPDHNCYIAAQQGRVLIFPPNWQYPHRGLLPTTTSKYIMSTYLHYKD